MWEQKNERPVLFLYAVALLSAASVVLLRWLLDPWLGTNYLPFVTIFAGVAFSVWIGGYRPAILTMIAAYLACRYLFIQPRDSFVLNSTREYIGLVAYLVTCSIIVLLGENFRNVHRKIREREKILNPLNSEMQNRIDEFKTLLDILPVGVWIGNQDCSEIYGTPTAYKMMSLPQGINASFSAEKPEIQSGLRIYINGVEVEPGDLPLQTVARTGKPWYDFEHVLVFPDGTKHVCLGNAAPLFDENGKVRQVIAAYTNFDGRKQLEQTLERQNDRNKILSELLQKLLSEDDPGRITAEIFAPIGSQISADTYCNYMVDETGSALRLLAHHGISEEQALQIATLKFGEEICGQVAVTRKPIIVNDIQNSANDEAGNTRALGIQTYACYPLMIGPRFLGTLSFGSKTRRQFHPDELEFIRAISQYVAIAINRLRILEQEHKARLAAEELSRMKDEFLATVSHELRTPLHSILGWGHLLQSGSLAPEAASSAITSIYMSAKSQAQIIDDLLDVARITTGKITLVPEKILLPDILNAAMNTVTHATKAKDIAVNLRFDADAEEICIQVDPKRMQQVFWNLLSNAVKFTPAGGTIDITARRANGHVSIAFRDTGIGIKPDFLPFVFERFRQADGSSTRRIGGLGLGLSISKDLVELHGGSISAESDGEGKGATFTVLLPCSPMSHEPAGVSKPLPTSQKIYTTVRLAFTRVLLVDDDPSTLKMLTEAFRHARAETRTSDNAAHALVIAREWAPELLVCDIAMPDHDGCWLVREVRSLLNGHRFCAVALTAYSSPEERTRALTSGFDTILSKPIEASEVLLSAEMLLRQEPAKNKEVSSQRTKTSDGLIETISVLTGKKILLVEDDLISSEVLQLALEQKGTKLRTAARAADALSILREWRPDAIISDLGLPDEDGYSLIQKIRAMPGVGSEIPALALTGYGKEDGKRALQAGFQNYKTKPIDPDSVISVLIEMLQQ